MTKRKCLKEHYVTYCEPICQVGREFRFFGYSITSIYCRFCGKVRNQIKMYFHIPRVFKKKDNEKPF